MSHFNDQASTWDDEEMVKMVALLAKEAIKTLKLSTPSDIMDFGCGTGLFGLEMFDYAKSLVGIDTSPGMLEIFNKKTASYSHIKSELLDLENEDYSGKFDLIISSMAFHHLQDPLNMIHKFKEMLNYNGRIAIIDLDQEDGSFHPNNEALGVKHFGFSKKEIMGWATSADLGLNYRIVNKLHQNNRDYHQFLSVLTLN